jgi:pyrroloquinoline-quinone synthase
MPGTDATIITTIRTSYARHPGFQHYFWKWFALGDFTEAQLRHFALVYYQHVKRFRLYIAGAITISPAEDLQRVLAENLADEYGVALAGQPLADSHPEMYRKFMRSLGLSEVDWKDAEPISGIRRFQEIHFALFRGGLVSETLGAVIFGMEASTPYRHGSVVEGLKRFREHSDLDIDATFFEAHVCGDEAHSRDLLNAAMPFIEADPEGVARGARLSFDARKVFLDDLAQALRVSSSEAV